MKHDGRSLPAPFLPVKVGSVDFPIEKGGIMFFLLISQVRFVSVKSIEIRCQIGKKCSEGKSSKQDKLKSDQEQERTKSSFLEEMIAEEGPVTCQGGCNMPGQL